MGKRSIREQLRGLIWRAPVAEEVDAELQFHLEMVTRELVEGGMTPEAARAEALRRFGNLEAVRQECHTLGSAERRERRWANWLAELGQDAVYALRQLRGAPGFALTAVLALALGIGATTAIFSAVRGVVLRPFPWAEPDRVMLVSESYRGQRTSMSAGNFVDLKASASRFEQLAAQDFDSFSLQEGDSPERVLAGRVTPGFFDVFGVRPLLGRTFLAAEDVEEAEVVLGHALWRGSFGADPGIVGRSIRLDGASYTVVGVMPPGFDPTLSAEQLWVPLVFTPAQRAGHDNRTLSAVGRLARDATPAQAGAQLAGIMRELEARYPAANTGRSARVEPLGEVLVSDWSRQLLVTLGAVGLVLLIACSNVANLLLARGASRARELAVRAALGAGRWRIVRQLLTESLVLALLGAAVGLALAWVGIQVLVASAPEGIPRLEETRIDGVVLLFALGAALLCSALFGLPPALRVARSNLDGVLRNGGRGLSGGRDTLRSGLIAAEVALAFTLLVGAGLLVRTGLHLGGVQPGFQPEGLVIGRITLPRQAWLEAEAVVSTFERILAQLDGSPAVSGAALASQVPLGPGGGDNFLLPEGRPETQDQHVLASRRIVSPGFFAVLGIPLKDGRLLGAEDTPGAPPAMLVSAELARRAFPDGRAVGRKVACCTLDPQARWREVAGVVGDVRSAGPLSDPEPEFYLPMRQVPTEAWDWEGRTLTLVVRRRGSMADAVTAMRAAVREVAPGVPLYGVVALEDALRASTARARFHTLLLGLLGAMGLVLAAVGIYGVVAYFVGLRRREIGVRMALGARPVDVLRMLAWQGMRPVLVGLLLGGVLAGWATRLLQASLRGVDPADPVSLAAAMGLLTLVALLATLAPARRALRVDPAQVLGEG